MPTIRNHGGSCCGVVHYSGFNGSRSFVTAESIATDLRYYELNEGSRSKGKLVEVVITDTQFREDPELAQKLKDNGFKIVNRFYNNTGGICNVLHRVGGSRNIATSRQPWVRILRSA